MNQFNESTETKTINGRPGSRDQVTVKKNVFARAAAAIGNTVLTVGDALAEGLGLRSSYPSDTYKRGEIPGPRAGYGQGDYARGYADGAESRRVSAINVREKLTPEQLRQKLGEADYLRLYAPHRGSKEYFRGHNDGYYAQKVMDYTGAFGLDAIQTTREKLGDAREACKHTAWVFDEMGVPRTDDNGRSLSIAARAQDVQDAFKAASDVMVWLDHRIDHLSNVGLIHPSSPRDPVQLGKRIKLFFDYVAMLTQERDFLKAQASHRAGKIDVLELSRNALEKDLREAQETIRAWAPFRTDSSANEIMELRGAVKAGRELIAKIEDENKALRAKADEAWQNVPQVVRDHQRVAEILPSGSGTVPERVAALIEDRNLAEQRLEKAQNEVTNASLAWATRAGLTEINGAFYPTKEVLQIDGQWFRKMKEGDKRVLGYRYRPETGACSDESVWCIGSPTRAERQQLISAIDLMSYEFVAPIQ